MGGVSSSDSSSSQQSEIWSGQRPFLRGLYRAGAEQIEAFQPNQQIAQGTIGALEQGLGAGSGPNPYLDDMTQRFRNELGYANQQSGGQAGLTGGFGGGRQGVAEHLNAQQYQSNVGNFLGGQYQQDQNRFAQERQSAIGQAGGVLGLQDYGQQQGALGDFSRLIGGPAILGSGSSSGGSQGFQVGK